MGGMPGSVALGFEPRGLFAEPDEVALRRFRRRLERTTGIPAGRARRRLIVDTVIRVALAAALLVTVVLIVTGLTPQISAPPLSVALGFGVLALVGLGGAAFLLAPVPRRWRWIRPWRHWFRLDAFAGDNGLVYRPEASAARSGTMFAQGKHPRVVDSLSTPDGAFEIGTFTFEPTNSRVGRDPAHGFLRIGLRRPVPHLVLVSVARRGFPGYSAVGLAFAESQRVRLEGDFDRTFAVYAPDGYGADARYVLTPDFMARLVDHAAAFDLEFIDDELHVYSGVPWDLENVATWSWALWFADLVGVAAVRRTSRFTDDRASTPGEAVAPQGRRLRVGIPLVAGLITAGWIVFQVLRVVLQNLG